MRRPLALLTWGTLILTAGCLSLQAPKLGVADADARQTMQGFTIAYARRNDLYIARGDGSDEALLMRGADLGRGGAIFMPALDPGRGRIAFLSVTDLDVRDSTGSDLSLNLLGIPGRSAAGVPAAVARRVRLARIAPPAAPGGRQEVFTTAGLAWSPGGDRIALGLNRDGPPRGDQVLVLDATGVPQTAYSLGGHELPRVGSFSWTPDGSAIILGLEDASDGGGLVARLTLAPAGLTMVGRGRYPALSPDGRSIAVVDDTSGQWDIVLLGADGAEMERFARPAGRALNRLLWSPDGRYLYYHSLASTGPLGLVEVGMLRCLDTRTREVFDLVRLG